MSMNVVLTFPSVSVIMSRNEATFPASSIADSVSPPAVTSSIRSFFYNFSCFPTFEIVLYRLDSLTHSTQMPRKFLQIRALNHNLLIIHSILQISFDIILSCQLKMHVEDLRIDLYLFRLIWFIGGFLTAFYAASRRIKSFCAVTNSLDLEDEKKIKLFTSI
jgi:hypothetical protein